MANDYRIQFQDRNNEHWQVLIKSNYIAPYGAYYVEAESNTLTVYFYINNPPLNTTGFLLSVFQPGLEQYAYTKSYSYPNNGVMYITIPYTGNYYYSLRVYKSDGNHEYIPLKGDYAVNTIVDLVAATNAPLVIKTINNGDDKDAFIKAKECTIQYLDTGGLGIENFVKDNSPDNQYIVTVQRKKPGYSPIPDPTHWDIQFVGFLQLDDISEVIQDHKKVVKLVATDKLGSLKEVAFKKAKSMNTLISYIALALAGTGLILSIKMCDSAKVVTNTSELDFFLNTYVLSNSFDDANKESSCLDVLQDILYPRMFVTQINGEWWIMGIDQYEGHPSYTFQSFNGYGTYNNSNTTYLGLNIGGNSTIKFVEQSAIKKNVRPVKKVKLTFHYKESESYLANQDYILGSLIGDEESVPYNYIIPPHDLKDNGIGNYKTADRKKYQLDGWTLGAINLSNGNIGTANVSAYIRRWFVEGEERMREIVIQSPPQSGGLDYYIQNNELIPIEKGDKIQFAFQWRLTSDLTFNFSMNLIPIPVAQVTLICDNGDEYNLNNSDKAKNGNHWVKKVNNVPLVWNGAQSTEWGYSVDRWLDIKGDNILGLNGGGNYSDPVPENGLLRIRLLNAVSNLGNGYGAQGTFRNIKLSIKKYNGDDIALAKGQYAMVSQEGMYNKKIEEQIGIDCVEKRLYKGALFYKDPMVLDFGYSLAQSIKSGGKTYETYSALADASQWNQHNRVFTIINGDISLKNAQLADLANELSIDGLPGKSYIMLSYEHDAAACMMRNVVLAEVFDSAKGKRYNDTITIGFINE